MQRCKASRIRILDIFEYIPRHGKTWIPEISESRAVGAEEEGIPTADATESVDEEKKMTRENRNERSTVFSREITQFGFIKSHTKRQT